MKKYGNRRLYDTAASRYITLGELADLIARGADVQVVDARSGADLTTATLAQIIVEGRGAARLLPAPLLVRLIRMGDSALAEFFGQYMSWALELYLQAKQGAQTISPVNPFLLASYGPAAALSRLLGDRARPGAARAAAPPSPARKGRGAAEAGELASLRRELDRLKKSLRRKRR